MATNKTTGRFGLLRAHPGLLCCLASQLVGGVIKVALSSGQLTPLHATCHSLYHAGEVLDFMTDVVILTMLPPAV